MEARGVMALVGRLGRVLVAAALVVSCGASASKDRDSDDPFGDPFFRDGFGTSSVDEVLEQPAPSVGWLTNEQLYDQERGRPGEGEEEMVARERSRAGAGQVVEAERRREVRERAEAGDDEGYDDADDGPRTSSSKREKSFSEKAQEATLATMSVLIGAGMAALPYLLGT